MGLGVISANTTIKVNGAIDSSITSSATMYTAPANGYAIINAVITSSTAGASIAIAGNTLISSVLGYPVVLYVGPSQSVVGSISTSGAMNINGVEFINSP